MADKVSSIEDLKDPEIAAMFDTDGDGLGEYWAGDVTWASTKRWQIKFKSYGLDQYWEQTSSLVTHLKLALPLLMLPHSRNYSIIGHQKRCMCNMT